MATFLNTMPHDIQWTIWKSYYTNIVLHEFTNKSLGLSVIRKTDWGIAVDKRWELIWHEFVPFDSTVSGQRGVGIEYDEWFPHYDSDSDSDSF